MNPIAMSHFVLVFILAFVASNSFVNGNPVAGAAAAIGWAIAFTLAVAA